MPASVSLLERAAPHVGLNLIFLVPGRDRRHGGRRARADPRAARRRAAGDALHGVRQPRGRGARATGRGASCCRRVTVPVHARNRVQWVLGEQTLLPRAGRAARASTCCTASRARRRCGAAFARVVTVHDLIYARFPEAHAGLRDKGMRVLVPPPRGARDRVIADSQSTRDDLVELLGLAAERIDVVPLGLGAVRRARAAAARPTLRERLALGERRVRARACRPSARTRTCCALIDALARDPRRARGRCSCCPAIRPRTRRELRERAAGARRATTTCACPAGCPSAELEGLWALADGVRVPVAVRGLRPAGARGDGARRAGRLLERLLAAGGRGRRRAAVRPRTTSGDRRGARARCSSDRRRSPSACARAGRAARARSSPGSARARADARRATRARWAGVAREHRLAARTRATARSALLGEPRGRALRAAPGPPSCTRTIASAIACGSALGATKPLTPSSTSSVAALSSPAHDDARRAARGGLDDDHPVALAPRGQQHAQRARASSASTRLGVGEAGRRRRSVERRARRSPRRAPRARGRRRRTRRAGPAIRSRRERDRRDAPAATASRGSGARRTARRGSAARRRAPRRSVAGVQPAQHRRPRRAGPPRAGARRAAREKQNARWRHARAQRAARARRRARRRRRGTRASSRALHTSNQSTTSSEARAAAARAPAASSEKYGNDAGVHDVVAAAVAQQVPEHAERRTRAAAGSAAARRRVERHPRARPRPPARRASSSSALAAVPLAQGQVGDLVALGAPAARPGCGTSARRRRRCTGTGSRRRRRRACARETARAVPVAIAARA